MAYQIVYSKVFNDALRKLNQSGKRGQVLKARASMTEAHTEGEIKSVERTNHGESRLPNIEKYNLGDGYRLVVQLLDGIAKTRGFLYIGSHEDTEQWLTDHRDYRWLKRQSDGTLEFVQITPPEPERLPAPPVVDLESPIELLSLPLLRDITEEEWKSLQFNTAVQEYAATRTSDDWERDAEGIFAHLHQIGGYDIASVLIDLLNHAHRREWEQLHARISYSQGQSQVVSGTSAAEAMSDEQNSDKFIVIEDLDELSKILKEGTMEDWMLFLHPAQRILVDRNFSGAARLRGVSGSGKTCVLVHRASRLATTTNNAIAVITLTQSMKRLLDVLLDALCTDERDLITTNTVIGFARRAIEKWHPDGSNSFKEASSTQVDSILERAVEAARSRAEFANSPLSDFTPDQLGQFMKDEVEFIRSRLLPVHFDRYLDAKTFHRRGRKLRLNAAGRFACLEAAKFVTNDLQQRRLLDPIGYVATALETIKAHPTGGGLYSSVLIDEVQDLGELELAMFAALCRPDGHALASSENGLFLVGDGAQTIYRRGFSLRSLGIEISRRSFVLKRNYRNTYEILRAAYALIERYEFSDSDEEEICPPTAPEFARRRGSQPTVVRCGDMYDEVQFVVTQIGSLLAMGQTPGQICIIATTPRRRTEVMDALSARKIQAAELRNDVDFESDRVKVSTIESAKGHEFATVFILGLVEGVLPREDIGLDEVPLEAARLYVAMTRARESLFLSYAPNPDYQDSRFLVPLLPYCTHARYTESAGLAKIN